MEPKARDWLAEVLGSTVTPVKDWSWPDGKAVVSEIRDGHGVTWFVKQHRHAEFYAAEVDAYERWVGAMGDRAPTLRANTADLRTLLLSALPSDTRTDWRDDDVRRDAGVALRRLHDAEDLGRYEDFAAEKEAELDMWLTRGPGLFETHEVDFARGAVRSLAGLPSPERVPCHRDYTPRNWVLGEGRVHVVDFEEMQPDAWTTDLGRMAIAWWPDDPHLMDPILDGYGRPLSDDDIAIMRYSYAVTAVRLIVLATELGKLDFLAATRDVLHRLRDTPS